MTHLLTTSMKVLVAVLSVQADKATNDGPEKSAANAARATNEDPAGPRASPIVGSDIRGDFKGSLIEVLTDAANSEFRGRVATGRGTVERQVALCNVTDKPVSVSIVRRSCGCLHDDFTEQVISPGMAATLTLRVDAFGVDGFQRHGVEFLARTIEATPQEERGGVTLSYTPDRVIQSVPSYLTHYGIAGYPVRFEVSVVRHVASELQIKSVRSTIKGLEAGSVRSDPLNPYVQHVEFALDREESGTAHGNVFVRYGADDRDVLNVPASVRVLSPYRPDPAGWVRDKQSRPSELTECVVRLVARAGVIARPSRVEINSETISAQLSTDPDGVSRLVLKDSDQATPERSRVRHARVFSADGLLLCELPIIDIGAASGTR